MELKKTVYVDEHMRRHPAPKGSMAVKRYESDSKALQRRAVHSILGILSMLPEELREAVLTRVTDCYRLSRLNRG